MDDALAPAPPPRARPNPAPALPATVDVICGWPVRTAVVVASRPHPQVVLTLRSLGFSAVRISPQVGLDAGDALGPFTFLLLDAEAMADLAGVEMARALRALCPGAQVVMLGAISPTTALRGAVTGVTTTVQPDDGPGLARVLTAALRVAGARRERVLAIGAHPDDVERGCAGALLAHRQRGDRLSMLTLGRRAASGHCASWSEDALATAEAIGAQLLLADAPGLDGEGAPDATAALLERVVRALDPTVVYLPTVHDADPEHRAVHVAGLRASRAVPSVLCYGSDQTTPQFRPTKLVPIDDVVARLTDVLRLRGRDAAPALAEARGHARALGGRARHAEPFEVLRDDVGTGVPPPALVTGSGRGPHRSFMHRGRQAAWRLDP